MEIKDCVVSLQAVDKNVFEKYPNIRYWMGKCQTQIVDFESSAKGAEIFGKWAHSFLSKLPVDPYDCTES